MLILKNSRPDFKSLFKEYLNKVLSSYNPYCYGYGYHDYGYDYNNYDDDYSDLFHGCDNTLFGDDVDDVYYNGYSKHYGVGINHNKRKRGCRGGRKNSSKNRSKCIPLYSHDDYDDDIVYPLKYNKNSKCTSSSSSKNVRYSDNEDNLFSRFDDDKKIYYYSDMNNPDDNVSIFYSVFDFDRFLDEEGISVNESDIQSLLNRSVSHCCINPFVKDRLELMTDSSFGGLHYQYAENNDDLLAAEDVLAHSSSVN